MRITGKDLIEAGYEPGKWFTQALSHVNRYVEGGATKEEALAMISKHQPPPQLPLSPSHSKPIYENIIPEGDAEETNVLNVKLNMQEVMRTPVTVAGAIMPDACPAGPLGTIPVGGVVSSTGIHPGMHSADICCSMAISIFAPGLDPAVLLNAIHDVTHFGPGGREFGSYMLKANEFIGVTDSRNPFLQNAKKMAGSHFGTQGDGNHFAYVGIMKSTGQVALVTHHGSRGPGAALYKDGMRAAERFRQQLSPETMKGNAWIPPDTREGDDYWEALQAIRTWTRGSHYVLHEHAAKRADAFISDRFWNEHNFVFRKSDGLFYHGKGATPAFDGWAADATDLTIIPLNMAQPILIARGRNADHGLGFSPHGAGRNFSRTAHKRAMGDRPIDEIVAEETKGIDARFYCGNPDISELPSAYKDAPAVKRQIEHFGLAEIVDEVLPYGCIMAGDWERDAPWRKRVV